MTIVQNTTGTVPFEATLNAIPYDLSGASEIEISLKQDVPELLFTRTLSAGDVEISGDNNEIATAAFTPAETLQFAPGFAKAQIRVKNGSTIVGDVAQVIRIAEANSKEAL